MAVAIASKSTSSSGTLTKPTGLAVGDLMVAVLFNTGSATWDTLTGWTAVGTAQDTIENGIARVSVQAKIAEASDVSATDFTFTGGATQHKTQLFRITSDGDFEGTIASLIVSDFDSDATGATPTSFPGGVTPNFANSLLILGAIQNTTSHAITLSSPAVTNNNPGTWTTQDSGGGGAVGFIVASATYSVATATGAYLVTSSINSAAGGFLLSIYDSGNASVTLDVASLTATPRDFASSTGGANVTLDAASITGTAQAVTASAAAAKWVNTDKSSAGSITNQDKTA